MIELNFHVAAGCRKQQSMNRSDEQNQQHHFPFPSWWFSSLFCASSFELDRENYIDWSQLLWRDCRLRQVTPESITFQRSRVSCFFSLFIPLPIIISNVICFATCKRFLCFEFFFVFTIFSSFSHFFSLYFHWNCRESKGRKCSLPVYNDDEDANDFNGFGYRANDTISGMGSVSEDYENQSVNVSVLIGFLYSKWFFDYMYVQLLHHSAKEKIKSVQVCFMCV